MKRLIILSLCLSLATPALSQNEGGEMSEGLDLLSEGTRMLLEGLMEELGPALEGLRKNLQDLDAYHPPEMLPNGDIIIRRKTPLNREDIPDDGIEL